MSEQLPLPQILLAATVGISLAAAVGFRVFVPLLLAGLAARTGHLHVADGFAWLGSDAALLMLGIAALAEIAAYFIPYFDHLLDVVSGPAAIAAGTLLMASTLFEIEPWVRWAIALVAGGGTAGLIHAITGGLRLGSTATTGGLANPAFAAVELSVAVALTVLAIALPLAALVLVIVVATRIRRRFRKTA